MYAIRSYYGSDGVTIGQTFHHIIPGYTAVANRGTQTQMRSGGGWHSARQGGLEQLADFDFPDGARQVAEEAIALVEAPECPVTTADLLLMPSHVITSYSIHYTKLYDLFHVHQTEEGVLQEFQTFEVETGMIK